MPSYVPIFQFPNGVAQDSGMRFATNDEAQAYIDAVEARSKTGAIAAGVKGKEIVKNDLGAEYQFVNGIASLIG